MVSICVRLSSGPSRFEPGSIRFFRKAEIYQHVINLFPPVLKTGSTKAAHVCSCLCDNECERSLAVYRKSGALYLSIYSLQVLNRGVNMIQTNKQTNKQNKKPRTVA